MFRTVVLIIQDMQVALDVYARASLVTKLISRQKNILLFSSTSCIVS